ncbi:GNAT family N-acetyltransferase [Paenibacillus cymbidii]|uniref:GNAT family N-acetyltransferase n=1 Tax=Paenibacillus cymbidii TaxID=1639034 RepID=UPI0010801788|nr:GNAT family N-acetyltransferase [Paenibacillus cymbidii]
MYRQTYYTFDEHNKPVSMTIRNYTASDFDELIDIQRECFPPPFPSELWWNKEQLRQHVDRFPQGALCVEIGGKLVGSMTALIVRYDPAHPLHTWADITDNGYIRNHDMAGDTLYVVDISVRPSYRRHGIGKWLMQGMYALVVHLDLDRLLGGGRMSGYGKVAHEMSAERYAEAVVAGEQRDPVITFLLRCGRTPVAVVPDYLPDEESRNYSLLMEWRNPFRHG